LGVVRWSGLVGNTAEPGKPKPSTEEAPLATDIHVEPPRGFYFQPFDVRLSTALGDGTIAYTTDGELPVPMSAGQGPKVTNVIVRITNTTVLRAAAFRNGLKPGRVETHTYVFHANVVRQTRPDNVGKTLAGWGAG